MDNPGPLFVDAPSADYASVAKTIINLKPRALTPPQYEDVLTLLEWVQSECVAMHEINEKRSAQLDERAAAITQREKELRVRARTIDVASMTQKAGSRFSRYFGR